MARDPKMGRSPRLAGTQTTSWFQKRAKSTPMFYSQQCETSFTRRSFVLRNLQRVLCLIVDPNRDPTSTSGARGAAAKAVRSRGPGGLRRIGLPPRLTTFPNRIECIFVAGAESAHSALRAVRCKRRPKYSGEQPYEARALRTAPSGETRSPRFGWSIRDLSGVVPDIAGEVLSPPSLASLQKLDLTALPLVKSAPPHEIRFGPCVGHVGKFICIGLNYSDHAAEAGMKVPSEPVIFMKATSAICGPNDDIVIPRGGTKTDWRSS